MKRLITPLMLLALVALSSAHAAPGTRAGRANAWAKWVQNPPTVPVSVAVPQLYAASGSQVRVTLGDGISVGFGDSYGCSGGTNGPTLFANLNVRRQYLLTVVATNLSYLELRLSVTPPLQLLSTKGSDAVPKAYKVYLDGYPADLINAAGNCDYYSNSWVVEIRDQQGARWLVDDQSNDPGPAPGDGHRLQMGPAKSLLTNRITVDWSVSLGRLYDGLAAGRLRLNESGLSRAAYTPNAIYYTAGSTNVRSQVELINANADGSLRQAKAFQTFVDIIDPWTFSIADVTALASLANRLKTETNGVSPWLSNQLASATIQALTNYQGGGSPAEPLQSLLVQDFNTLLAVPSLYESNRFAAVSLSAETQFLVGQNPQTGADLFRLNRLLLEDAYPSELARRPCRTALHFYLPAQVGTGTNRAGVYTNITGSAFVSWFIQNPSPTTTTNLAIIESRNGVNDTNTIEYRPQAGHGTWTLTSGAGGERRVETRDVALVLGVGTNRFETNTIRYAGSSTNAYKCVEQYTLFGWGWELEQTRVDPEGDNLVTAFEFYDDPQDPVTLGKPSVVRHPDGNWEARIYEALTGSLQYVLRPFNGLPEDPADANFWNCEATHYEPWFDVYQGYWANLRHFLEDMNYGLLSTESVGSSVAWGGGPLKEYDGFVNYNYAGHFIGTRRLRAPEEAGKGVAGHEYFSSDARSAARVGYFQGGTYNEATGQFTVAPGGPAQGPDWRECVLVQNSQYYEAAAVPTYNDWFYVDSLEGQTLYSDDNLICLHTGRSTRESTVFHNGSPVQKETAVFTGVDGLGQALFEACQRFVYTNDALGRTTNITLIDVSNPTVKRVLYEANYRDANGQDGELLRWEVDETGTRTEYAYDSLKRKVQMRQVGVTNTLAAVPDVVTTTSYDAFGRTTLQVQTGGTLAMTNRWTYDIAGRVVSETSGNGLSTNYTYGSGGRVTTTTLPSGSTLVRENYLERRLKSLTGSGVVAEYHTNVLSSDWEIRLLDNITWGSPDSSRWTGRGQNILGVQTYACSPDFDDAGFVERQLWYGNWLHQPRLEYASGKAPTYYEVDFDGQVSQTSEQDPFLDSVGRTAVTVRDYAKVGGHWFRFETNLTYLTDYSAQATVTGVHMERVSGFTSASVVSEIKTWDADTNLTVVTAYLDRGANTVTEVTDTAQSTLNATNITVAGLPVAESTPTVAAPTRRFYDALGRETRVVSPLGYTATTEYNPFGQVTRQSDFTGQSTFYEYYQNGETGAGQVKSMMRDGRRTYYSYTARGELQRVWGHVPYPEERVYSVYGELVQLRTFRGGTGWSAPAWPAATAGACDTTTWVYQEHSGLLTNKTDAAGRGVSFTYLDGILHSRSWARSTGGNPVTNAFGYTLFGDLAFLEYSDGTPSVYYNNYNRAGLPRQIVDAAGENELVYDHASRLVLTTNVNGLLAGLAVSNRFDGVHGRSLLQVLGASTPVSHAFAYDNYGRLGSVASGVFSAGYGYLGDSDLLRTTTCKSNSTPILTTTRSWDYGMRLGAILNEVGGVNVSSHSYDYDTANRRTGARLQDGSFWVYDYNHRDELTGARRYWYDLMPVAGQQFGFDYDNIGNRKTAQFGGDGSGLNLRGIGYAVNSLNQYTTITNLGYANILGAALATNGVWVNNGLAERKGEYFRRELSVANGNGPLWTNVAVASAGVTNGGGIIVPDDRQTLVYDLDGNLAFDGTWSYEWDGENRLKVMTMTNVATIPNPQRKRLEFGYDHMNRRISKVVKTWNGSSFTSPVTNLFVYDGWNLLAELNTLHSSLCTYLWGQDLSGTMDGAGGVGGLLMVARHGSPSTNCFVAFDGNGNVTALLNAVSGAVEARYEYNPYGEILRTTGPLASNNTFRWSTKFWDEESGLVYYGYRYYSPGLGRWVNRDPFAEKGGNNLYGFCYNRPGDFVDTLGDTSGGWDGNGFHIHIDKEYSYGVIPVGDHYEIVVNQTHPGQYNEAKAQAHFQELMSSPEGVKRFQSMWGTMHVPGQGGYGSAWRMLPNMRNMMRAGGRNAWRALKKAGKVAGGVIVIATAVSSSSYAAEIAESYGRHMKNGELAYAELDAVDLALTIMDATGNYYMGYLALDILLP